MKKNIIMAVIGIVGIGIGLAAGMYVSNTKSKTVIADIQTKMQQDQARSQDRINAYDMMINSLNNQLQQAKLDIEKMKTITPAPEPVAASATASITAGTSTQSSQQVEYEKPDGPPSAYAAQSGSTRSYTIQSGDSLWSIAQKQLGDGSRFKEILKLNPKLTAKSNLNVGSVLKIPGK